MKENDVNINIESIHIENLNITGDSLDFLKKLNIKSIIKFNLSIFIENKCND